MDSTHSVLFSILLVVASGHAQLFSCDFENQCNLTSDTTATWSTVEAGVGRYPEADHTYDSSTGHYLYATLRVGETARVITKDLPITTAKKCTELYVYMNGQSAGVLNAYIRKSGQPTPTNPAFTLQGNQGNQWVRAFFTVFKQTKLFQIVIEAKDGDVSIDDITIVDGDCPKIDWKCTFEDNKCGMIQDNTDDFNFKRQNKGTNTWNTGPKHDHTYNNATGYYMYIEANKVDVGHTARLITPLLRGTPDPAQPSCLIFFYDMYGEDVDSLNVYVTYPGGTAFPGDLVWSLAGNRGDQWRGAEVVINNTQDFQIVFEATRGDDVKADIAIDDVEFDGFAHCPGHNVLLNHSSISCTFEEIELCYYTQDKTDDFDWSWKNRGTPVSYTGPDVDHTRGDELGFFMLINPSNSKPIGAKARLISPLSSPLPQGGCLEFYYNMYGIDVETLNVYTKTEDEDLPGTQVWTKQGNQGNYWHRATFATPRGQAFQVVFEGVRGIESRDDVAIDDVFLYTDGPNSCPPKPTPEIIPPTPSASTPGFVCDFEEDWCGFTQAPWDQGDWSRIKPKTNGFLLKNSWDHTTRSNQGYFITFDPSRGKYSKNDRSRIYSPMLTPSDGPRCLTYYYHMAGNNVDHMGFHIRNFNEPLPLDPILSVFGIHPWGWNEQKYTIDPTEQYFQICFYISVGPKTWYSAIAVDDISVVDGACEAPPTSTPETANCNFDRNICDYVQSKSDNFDWTRRNGPTASLYTGPQTDHTSGTLEGYYMYTETSSARRPGDAAELISSPLSGEHEGLCLQFYYYMYGRDIGNLAVYLYPEQSDYQTLVQVSGDQGQKWFHTNVDIAPTPFETFQIVFQGVVGGGPRGDIAIDDVTVFNNPCGGVRTGSSCDFERGPQECGYSEANGMGSEWGWYDALSILPPPVDGMAGSFMYKSPAPGAMASFTTPTVDVRSAKKYTLSLDYQLFNDSNMVLAISIERRNNTDDHMLTQQTGDVAGVVNTQIDVDTEDLHMDIVKIVFTASTTSSPSFGVVAVDNVVFKPMVTDSKPTNSSPIIKSYRGETIVLGVILSLAIVIILVVFITLLMRRSRSSGMLTIGYKNNKEDLTTSDPAVISSGMDGTKNGIDNPNYVHSIN